jgi:hypothetical protein
MYLETNTFPAIAIALGIGTPFEASNFKNLGSGTFSSVFMRAYGQGLRFSSICPYKQHMKYLLILICQQTKQKPQLQPPSFATFPSLSTHAFLMMNQTDVDKTDLEIDELQDDDYEDEEDQSSEIYDTALNPNTARMLTTHELHCK